jgi:amino acid adenylation domain-containing protein
VTAVLHEYLLAYAVATPDAPAIVNGGQTWSYAELRDRSRGYAEQLHEHGLRLGDVVVLEFDPCAEAIALIIAAASLGLPFVNISPAMPDARKEFIVEHVEARVHLRAAHLDAGYRLRLAPHLRPRTERADADRAGRPHTPVETDIAYIVFTSGSTGTPKGIVMSHRAVVSFWHGMNGFGVDPGVRLGSIAPLQFDFALLDLGMALSNGGCLVQVPSILIQQPRGFVSHLAKHEVTQMNGVPAIWRELVGSGCADLLRATRLSTVVCGGDAFPAAGFRALRKALPGLRLVHIFGQSESIACAYKVLPDPIPEVDGRAPCGTTVIAGMRLSIVDELGRLVDRPGVVGECHVEGDCLFDGYWKDPEGTAAVLVPSPVSAPRVRAFRSGDLVFRDDHGDLYFHARRDSQVKLLGNRVELEEIDAHLARHPAVVQAACVLVPDEPPSLVAFIQTGVVGTAAEHTNLVRRLREHCAAILPRYMVPHRFTIRDHLPLTVNGKVDRGALLVDWRSS